MNKTGTDIDKAIKIMNISDLYLNAVKKLWKSNKWPSNRIR